MAELARWTRVAMASGGPLDLLAARFDRHRYAPHAHENFAVGVTLGGLETIDYRGARHLSGPGSIVVLEPGETHTGGPAAAEGYAYRAFCPSAALLAEGVTGRPYFQQPVIEDTALTAAPHPGSWVSRPAPTAIAFKTAASPRADDRTAHHLISEIRGGGGVEPWLVAGGCARRWGSSGGSRTYLTIKVAVDGVSVPMSSSPAAPCCCS